jgi:hypothetical protein
VKDQNVFVSILREFDQVKKMNVLSSKDLKEKIFTPVYIHQFFEPDLFFEYVAPY